MDNNYDDNSDENDNNYHYYFFLQQRFRSPLLWDSRQCFNVGLSWPAWMLPGKYLFSPVPSCHPSSLKWEDRSLVFSVNIVSKWLPSKASVRSLKLISILTLHQKYLVVDLYVYLYSFISAKSWRMSLSFEPQVLLNNHQSNIFWWNLTIIDLCKLAKLFVYYVV